MRNAVLIILAVFLTASIPVIHPTYDMSSGVIRCWNAETCRHEVGHALDADAGRVSQTRGYQNAVMLYARVAWMTQPDARTEMQNLICWFPGVTNPITDTGWGGYDELYASMYAWAEGKPENMPAEFREYYDFDKGNLLFDGVNTWEK